MFIWGPIPSGAAAGGGITYIVVSDSGSGADAVVAAMTAASLADSGVGVDGVVMFVSFLPIGVSDLGSGADSLAVKLGKVISDAGFGIEAHTTEAVEEFAEITIPVGMDQLVIESWGKGGGGGINYGGGGGGGAYGKKTIFVSPGQRYYGVDEGYSESPSIVYLETDGDDEQITLVPAGGDANWTTPGVGGLSADSEGCDVSYSGGDGAAGNGTDQPGGGGSSAGTASNGTDASGPNGGTAPSGGGDGGDADEAGTTPGGGGGGSSSSSPFGKGAAQFRFSGTKRTGGIQVYILATKDVSDTGAGSDQASVAADIPVSDVGSGVDQDSVMGVATIADTGSGADELAGIVAAILQSDSGVGADAIGSIQAILLLADVGSGADIIAVSGNVSYVNLSDLGLGDDTVGIHAAIVIGDAGVGGYVHIGGAWVGCHVYVKVGGAWVPTA